MRALDAEGNRKVAKILRTVDWAQQGISEGKDITKIILG